MPSVLISILKEELTQQRTFISSDEETALERPATYANEDDLALDRVKRRRSTFYGVLRDRFLRDAKPLDEWRRLVQEEEAAAGGQTIISQLASQVLEWAARTSDRGAMIGGFAAKTLRWIGMILFLLGAYGWFQGAPTGGAIVIAVALVLLLTGRIVGHLAAERVQMLAQRVRSAGDDNR